VHRDGFPKDDFHAAAECGHHDIIRFLLDSGLTMLKPLTFGRAMGHLISPARDLLPESSPDDREQMRKYNAPYHSGEVTCVFCRKNQHR
jgi:hypothetical protein